MYFYVTEAETHLHTPPPLFLMHPDDRQTVHFTYTQANVVHSELWLELNSAHVPLCHTVCLLAASARLPTVALESRHVVTTFCTCEHTECTTPARSGETKPKSLTLSVCCMW